MAKIHEVYENDKKLGEVRKRGERIQVKCFIEFGNPTWEADSIEEGIDQLLSMGDLYLSVVKEVPC